MSELIKDLAKDPEIQIIALVSKIDELESQLEQKDKELKEWRSGNYKTLMDNPFKELTDIIKQQKERITELEKVLNEAADDLLNFHDIDDVIILAYEYRDIAKGDK